MLDNSKVLELQIELKEKKQELEKSEDRLIKVIVGFIFCAVCSLVLFFKVKAESWIAPSFCVLAVVFLLFSFISYKDYQKKQKRIEQLEKELARLRKARCDKKAD